jgi:hypothetical protein|tara:strand:+ start:432 stop:644 length:213 start_codon:yes stop_codon:yes gene_type:complete
MKNTDKLLKLTAKMSAIADSCEWAMGRNDLSSNEKADFVTKKMKELSTLQAQADAEAKPIRSLVKILNKK